MKKSTRTPLTQPRRALTLAAVAAFGALALTSFSAPAHAQTTPTNVQLLDQALNQSAGSDGVVIDDMIFPRANFLDYRNRVAKQGSRSLSSAFYNTARWTGGNVYYSFNASLPTAQRTAFLEATQEWEKWVNVKFTARTNQANYINVYHDASDGSFSYIGMVGGVQDMSLASWATKWTACHEIAHALGAMHEQCRSDRDNYVSIDFSNIPSSAASNFAIVSDSINKGAFDFDSVMLYFSTAFAIDNSKYTIICKPSYTQYQDTMGQRDHLSTSDKAGMISIYGAPVSNYSLSGVVSVGTQKLSGVVLTLNNGQTATTNTSGVYTFASLPGAAYTLTPSKAGYTFSPASRQFTLSGNVTTANFAATAATVALPTVSVTSVNMVEGNAGAPYITFNVSLSQPSTQAVSVNFTTANGTATAGSDYTARSGTITIPAGSTMADIRVNILPDRVVEANETFTVVLSNPAGATLATYVGRATIINDDRASDATRSVAADEPSMGNG